MTRSTPGASRVKVKHTTGHRSRLSCAAQSPDALRHWRCSSRFCARGRSGTRVALTLEADLPLPGDSSRFDYESYDARRHLLFIAHWVKRASGLRYPNATGDQEDRGCGTCTAYWRFRSSVVSMQAHRYRRGRGDRRRELDRGGPDAGGTYRMEWRTRPQAGKLYVSDENRRDRNRDRRPVQSAHRDDSSGWRGRQYAVRSVSRHIYVNVQSRRQLVEIDPATDRVVARIDLRARKGNHGLLIEPDLRLALIACEDNDKPAVFDLESRQVGARSRSARGPTCWPTTPRWPDLRASESGRSRCPRTRSRPAQVGLYQQSVIALRARQVDPGDDPVGRRIDFDQLPARLHVHVDVPGNGIVLRIADLATQRNRRDALIGRTSITVSVSPVSSETYSLPACGAYAIPSG